MTQALLYVAVIAALFVAISAQEATECGNLAGDPDDGTNNWGDLVCYAIREDAPYSLLTSDTIINGVEDIGFTTSQTLVGYEVTFVTFFNFGRERGYVTSIVIDNNAETGVATVTTAVTSNVNEQVRMILELNGGVASTKDNLPRNITRSVTHLKGIH